MAERWSPGSTICHFYVAMEAGGSDHPLSGIEPYLDKTSTIVQDVPKVIFKHIVEYRDFSLVSKAFISISIWFFSQLVGVK